MDDVRNLFEVSNIFLKLFSSFCISSSSEWQRSLKVDLEYQMRAYTPFTISCKPCGIYNSCSPLRFQQSTTPYSLLMDYRQHTFHQETAAAEEMPGRLTTRNKISRKSRAASETLSKWENEGVTFYLMKTYENIKVFAILKRALFTWDLEPMQEFDTCRSAENVLQLPQSQ